MGAGSPAPETQQAEGTDHISLAYIVCQSTNLTGFALKAAITRRRAWPLSSTADAYLEIWSATRPSGHR